MTRQWISASAEIAFVFWAPVSVFLKKKFEAMLLQQKKNKQK